jgi:hypothetical protein
MKLETNIGIIDIKIDDILEMPSESLLEKMLEYSEMYDIDVTYLAELFEGNKVLKETLYSDCVLHNVIKDDELKEILDNRIQSQESNQEW